MINNKLKSGLKTLNVDLDKIKLCEEGNESWIVNDEHTIMTKIKSLKTDDMKFIEDNPHFFDNLKDCIDATSIFQFNYIDGFLQTIKSKYKKKDLKNVKLQISLGNDSPIIIEEINPDNELGNQMIVAPMIIDKVGEFECKYQKAHAILVNIKSNLEDIPFEQLSKEELVELLKMVRNRVNRIDKGDNNE